MASSTGWTGESAGEPRGARQDGRYEGGTFAVQQGPERTDNGRNENRSGLAGESGLNLMENSAEGQS